MFVGRERELAALRSEYEKEAPSLVVMRGRRRVGKSHLLRESAKDRKHVYFQAARVSDSLNLEGFKAAISMELGPSPVLEGIKSWEATLYYLASLKRSHPKLVVIIDEFPYLVEQLPELPSMLQRFWDSETNSGGNLKLVLCGSALSMMSDLLAERNPLYGRTTRPFRIEPLPLRDVAQFFPSYGDVDIVTMYGILGGMPYYLQACDPTTDLRSNISRLLLDETGSLYEEPQNLLSGEFREPASYSSIIAAISQGCTTSNEIAQRVGRKDTRALGPYLKGLEDLDLIEVSRSLDASPKGRDTHVAIKDNLLAFWYRFVLPNLGPIASGHGKQVFDHVVAPRLSEYMGRAFERICIEHLKLHAQEHLGVPFQEIGQIWGRDFDIDIAGELLDGTQFFGECKWQNAPMDIGMLKKLTEHAEATRYSKDRTKNLLLFSKGGFKADLQALADQEENLHLISVPSLLHGATNAPKAGPQGGR